MEAIEKRLFDLIRHRSLLADEIDLRATTICAEGARLVGEVLYDRTSSYHIDALGAVGTGSVPLITAGVISFYHRGRPLDGFWVRDDIKDHGTMKLIEGRFRLGARIALVVELLTTGQGTIDAIDLVRQAGGEVVIVVALLEEFDGAWPLLQQHGVPSYSVVFTGADFGPPVP